MKNQITTMKNSITIGSRVTILVSDSVTLNVGVKEPLGVMQVT
jgi:hypothetical protein